MIGKQLGQRYEIMERIGGGGTAIVYKAKDILLNRLVAVKLLRGQFTNDEHFVKRFQREAQSAASLSHPNIVNIYDVGVDEEDHYIIMEYVQGPTLKEYISTNAPISIDKAVNFTKQIAQALKHAHQNQIIHRDIKPHNILLNQHGQAKVTDFGIARAVSSSTITHTGSVMGSVHYFSPEQARGGITGEKSDLYSLGVVLYEMVTGELPFEGESPISVALKHLQDKFKEPRLINADIPQSVENIITKTMAKDVALRYSSAQDLITDLETCLFADRKWEKKLILDAEWDDDQSTKAIPAIKEDMYDTTIVSSRSKRNHQDAQVLSAEDEQRLHSKLKSKRKRTLIKIGIAILLIFIIFLALYQGISSLFYVQEVDVPDVTGMSVEDAIAELEGVDLQVDENVQERHSDDFEEGQVIQSDPGANQTIKVDTVIRLTVSLGRAMEEMPSLENQPQSSAMTMLGLRGFSEENITLEENFSDEVRLGYVIRQHPEAGEMVVPDEVQITLVISRGVKTTEMPNLIRMTEAQAEAMLDRSNLELGGVDYEYNEMEEGLVYRQHPFEPGEDVPIGSPVLMWISQGPQFQELSRQISVDGPEEIEDTGPGQGQAPPGQATDDEEEQEVNVRIEIRDVNSERIEIDETIQDDKTYTIDVMVSRTEQARIRVYRNGELDQEIEIRFESNGG